MKHHTKNIVAVTGGNSHRDVYYGLVYHRSLAAAVRRVVSRNPFVDKQCPGPAIVLTAAGRTVIDAYIASTQCCVAISIRQAYDNASTNSQEATR